MFPSRFFLGGYFPQVYWPGSSALAVEVSVITRLGSFGVGLAAYGVVPQEPEVVITSRAACYRVPIELRSYLVPADPRVMLVEEEDLAVLVPSDC